MKKCLLIVMMATSAYAAIAQSPTIVSTATNCTVFRNFNTTDENFSSPSIYSSAEDVSFYWNAAAGAEIENSGLTARSGSLISPPYLINLPGQVTVGFRFNAPVGTEFRIRVISGVSQPPLEVLANTANGPFYTALPGTSGNVCLLLNDADLTLGREVRFEFTFRAINPGNILFDDLALTVAGGPLPVVFEGFVARKNPNGSIKLLWDVGTEINVQGYYIESSTNAVDFTPAGYVSASGKDIYSFDYTEKQLQTLFFRVKSVDFDGKFKYTPVIKVYAKDQDNAPIQIYPVPATDQVTIQHSKAPENAMITLITPDGKIVQQKVVLTNTLQTQLNISTLGIGLYIVRYDDGNDNIQIGKIIKN